MTTRTPIFSFMKPIVLLGLTAILSVSSIYAGGYGGSTSGIAERERARRMARVQDAEAAVVRGDQLMVDGDCEGALNEYKTALDLIPEAPMTMALRETINAKYCKAAVCLAKERADNGRYQDAKSLLNDALARHPGCKEAEKLMEHLDDPDRYEPALTPEHVKNVEEVSRLLKVAYSYYNLGDYDSANLTFQDVLRIDSYNKAARRGMEQVEQRRALYYETARDQQRAKMLNEVNRAWEDQVPEAFVAADANILTGPVDPGRYYTEKMQKIVFPSLQFQGASIDEAIEFLRIKSKDFDTVEKDPTKRGVNLILRTGPTPSTAQISLDLKDVPMTEALRYITELAGMKYKVEPFAVVVVPLSDLTAEQYTRTFTVPPDFLSGASGGEGGGGAAAPVDPFANNAAGGGGGGNTFKRPLAIDILKQNGITFPEGSSATFVAATSQLIVKNTQPNIDAIEAFVDSLRKKIPQQIYITSKFVEVTQKNTDELGFDWLLGQFNIGGDAKTFGSGGDTLSSDSSSDYSFSQNGTAIGQYALTGSNRSGTGAITPDSIDGLLSGASAAAGVTPGIFSLAGVFTDPQFQVVIRALAQKKGVDLMSAPSVTMKPGAQRATIEVVREFIYPTEYEPPQIPQQIGATGGASTAIGSSSASSYPVTPATPGGWEMRRVGVVMEVDAVLGGDGYTIDLTLAPEVTEFEGFINYGSPIQSAATDALGNPTVVVLTDNRIEQPVFSTRKVNTSVTLWDGQTVAMGGLIREDVQDVEDKVPILGDIPIVGRLFQSKAEDHFKRNLMIFVTAKLIDPSGQEVRPRTKKIIAAPAPEIMPTAAVGGAPGVLPAINP